MEEVQKTSRHSAFFYIVLVLCILVGSYALSYLGSLLNRLCHTGLFDFAVILVITFAALWVYRTYVLEYRYKLLDTRLSVEVLYGKRSRVVFFEDLKKVEEFADAVHPYPLVSRYYVRDTKNPHKQIVYKKGKKLHRIVFAPQESMAQEIRKAMHARH